MFSSVTKAINAVKLFQQIRKPVQQSVRHVCPPNFKNFLKAAPVAEISKLENGMTIATEYRETPHVCVGLYFDAGSRYEGGFENGIAHFFEHVAFKGTKKRKKATLHETMSKTGAQFRCFSGREMCAYYAQCLVPDTELVIDILNDCIFCNSLEPKEIENQMNALYCEQLEHDNDPNEILFDYLHAAAFQGTGLANTVLGPTLNIHNYTAKLVEIYIAKVFYPTRCVLAAVGPVPHDTIKKFTERCMNLFGPCRQLDIPYRYTGGDMRFRDDSMPLANCAIAFEAPSLCHRDTYALDVAAAYIGGWDASQLGTRDNAHIIAQASKAHNICEAYQAFNIKYKDCGLWGVQFMGDRLYLDEVVYNIQQQFMKMCTYINAKEVKRAKVELKTQILTVLDSAEKACHDLGRWVLYDGSRPPIQERFNMIDQVGPREVQDVCDTYLYDREPVVAGVGPVEGLPDYVRIRAGQYWLRF